MPSSSDLNDNHFSINWPADEDLANYFGSAMEHGLIEQLQAPNLWRFRRVKLLQIANTNGQENIFMANSANWSTSQGQLVITAPVSLSRLAAMTSQDTRFVAAKRPELVAGNWRVRLYGFLAREALWDADSIGAY